jgi:hypothetical protein
MRCDGGKKIRVCGKYPFWVLKGRDIYPEKGPFSVNKALFPPSVLTEISPGAS